MSIKLPSRYEDLDVAFRGKLRPVNELIDITQKGLISIQVSGGLRFLPIYGESGSGKSSAAREIGTHLPEIKVLEIPRVALNSLEELKDFMILHSQYLPFQKLIVAVIDQYEEAVASRLEIPSQFVEWLSLLDRDSDFSKTPWMFFWLTTSKDFQKKLEDATSRNRRILLASGFELTGPQKDDWPAIIEETFEFHNSGKPLADFGVLLGEIENVSRSKNTLGATIEAIGELLAKEFPRLHDMSQYQVIMLWPVTDGQRINTILRFVDGREGYKLDWNAWYRQLNDVDRAQLPLAEYNRARLYFDMRLVPVAAADLQPLCKNLDEDDYEVPATYLERFGLTHYVSIVKGTWDPSRYAALRERESSSRAKEARAWYDTITQHPTKLGKRIALALSQIHIPSEHEKTITSPNGSVRADVFSVRPGSRQNQIITEMKVYSPDNTIPSQIRDAVRTTLKRHADFAGYLQRQ